MKLYLFLLLIFVGHTGLCQANLDTDLARFEKGDTKVFSTFELYKAQGLNMRLTLPSNWEERDAQMPNIVKQFFSPTGVSLMVAIRKDNSIVSYTSKEVLASFTPSILQKVFPSPALILSTNSNFQLNGRVAAFVIYKTLVNGNDSFDGNSRMLKCKTYITYYKNYSITLGFTVTGQSEEFVDSMFKYNAPLFVQIAQTMSVQQ